MIRKLTTLLLLLALPVLLDGAVNYHAVVAKKKAGGGSPPAGLSWTNLTSGSEPDTEPSTTASISPTANADVFIAIVVAVAGGGVTDTGDSMSVSGCGLTWTEVAEQPYGAGTNRRTVYVFHGTSASPSSGVLTLDFTSGYASTWTEHAWVVSEVTGADSTPYTNVVGASAGSGTTGTVTVTGTVDSGDHVYFAVAHESDEAVSLEAGFTQLAGVTGGGDTRTIHAGYDDTPTIDQTPSATWSSSSSWAAVGFIVEVAP